MNTIRNILIGICAAAAIHATSDARADFAFGEPVNLRSVIPAVDPAYECVACISSDGLEMYVESLRPEGQGGFDLWVLKRGSIDRDWGDPENLGAIVNTANDEGVACLSADGLTLYFVSNRPGGYGDLDIYMTTRVATDAPWGWPVNMGSKINSPGWDTIGGILPNGRELYFSSTRVGGYGQEDVYVTRRAALNDLWGDPVNLGPSVNTADSDGATVSPDGLLLLIHTDRPGGHGGPDVWMSRRAGLSGTWQMPVNLGPKINSSGLDGGARVSPDGRMLWWFDSNYENWQIPIMPVVDFNADGKVDLVDLVALVENWGTDDTLYDIGPYAWGDGKVDIEDLKVFMSYWEKENPPAQP